MPDVSTPEEGTTFVRGQVALSQVSPSARSGVLVLDGYGLRIAVERKHLVVMDGICDERRTGRFAKATAGLKRLVVLGHTGFITLEALRWLKDVGAAFLQIDADGQVIALSAPAGLDEARLRRAQALAALNGTGMQIAQALVHRKLAGQATVLQRTPGDNSGARAIDQALAKLPRARTLDELRVYEAEAGAAYWGAWEHLPVQFARQDVPRVPEHWRTYGGRTSPLTGSPRKAANPANAILNYLYALLEAETRIACLTIGLDPGLGVFHADQRNRDSPALDIMEAVRPDVDGYVQEMLQMRVFRALDFHETREGVCRVLPPLTHVLAETGPVWAKKVAPVVEQVAQALVKTSRTGSNLPTRLTEANRSAGRNGTRQRSRRASPTVPGLPRACRICGEVFQGPKRSFCDACLPQHRREAVEPWQTSGPAALARLMAAGRDPTHGGEAAKKRAAKILLRNREAAKWDRHNDRPDPKEFAKKILPNLQGVPIEKMARATGLSLMYCSLIRRGLYVPHPATGARSS